MSQNIPFNIHEETYDDFLLNRILNLIDISFLINQTEPIDAFFSMLLYSDLENIDSDTNFYKNKINKKDIILDISSKMYNNVISNETSCSICLEKYKNESIVSVLNNCKHIFHKECILKAGKYKAKCPLCRTDIPVLNKID